jgi:signal transduction histidine kinase
MEMPREKIKFDFFLNTSLVLALSILLALGWLSIRSMMSMQMYDRQTSQSYEEARKWETFLSLMEMSAADQFGYTLTGKPSYLESFSNAVYDVKLIWKALKTSIQDDKFLQGKLESIYLLTVKSLAGAENNIQLRKTEKIQAARQAVIAGESDQILDMIRRQVTEFQDETQSRLWRRSKAKAASTLHMMLTLTTRGTLSLATIGAVFYFLKRESARRNSAENDLYLQKEHLQDLVDERIRDLRELNVQLKTEIAKHEQTENALHVSETKLLESDRRKDEFLAMLAHELRNPLAPIRNAMHILCVKGVKEETLQRQRDLVDRQVTHMSRLLDDLLEISRIARGKIDLHLHPVAVADILTRAVETASPLIRACKHTLNFPSPPAGLGVEGDLDRLVRIVGNLLTNAAKYTNEGGGIWLEASAEGGEAVIRVRDTGIGIAPGMLDHIFDLFVQANRGLDRSQGGLGIGLTLVRSLVQLHGGRVEARSPGLGKGSEFIVRLPALLKIAVPQPGPPAVVHASVRIPAFRVLIVDDVPDTVQSLAEILQVWGQTVSTASDGLAAVEAAETFKPDIILLDIGLPVLNGFEVAKRIKQSSDRAITIISMSGYGQEADRQKAKNSGIDHYLVKPVDLNFLQILFEQIKPS